MAAAMQRSMAMFRLIWKERLNFKTAKLTAKESDGLANAEPPEEGDLSGQFPQQRSQKDAA